MQRYNIALLPIDSRWQHFFQQISQTYFASIHDDYILSANGLAHVTLCQFYVQSIDTAVTAFQSLPNKTTFDLQVSGFRIRQGAMANKGKFIADLQILNQPSLVNAQSDCATHLLQNNLESLTPVATYSPHITLARLSAAPAAELLIPEASDCYHKNIQFCYALGQSTEPGVFVRKIC